MPGGRTHDAITFLLAVPTGAIVYIVTKEVAATLMIAGAFIFGGLMFGPDLDTKSRQYSRWSVFRCLWYPYRSFFPHRSRFSHGLLLGSLIRVVYFLGILTVLGFVVLYAYTAYAGGKMPVFDDVIAVWRAIGTASRSWFGEHFLVSLFLGLWVGAASHTFTDMAGSFIRTGRVRDFL